MSKTDGRAAIRSFLQAATTAEPSAADYQEMGLPEATERALRVSVRAIRKAAGSRSGGSWDLRAAQAIIDDLTPGLVAAMPADWTPPTESPTELAERVLERRGY